MRTIDFQVMEYLFVYGTLLDTDNQAAQILKSNAHFYAEGYFHGKLFDLGDYPGAVLCDNPQEKVFGHIFELAKPLIILQFLDKYEETGDLFPEPHEFIRLKTAIFTKNKEKLSCWIYLYNRSTENLRQIKKWRISG